LPSVAHGLFLSLFETKCFFFNPKPHCLGISKAFFEQMKISPGWLKQNFFKIKNASQKILTNFFVPEVFI
jgi:hypothetical protein